MNGFKFENTDLPWTSEHTRKEARVVRVWSDYRATYYYKLYKPYKGLFRGNVWVEREYTEDFAKARRWANYYGVKIEL